MDLSRLSIFKKVFFAVHSFWLLLSPFSSIGQTAQDLPSIVPLSPNAAELSKYGNIPVNLSVGVPNIDIPIYEINTGDIKVPIALNYYASGIQVNQRASSVGLGWSLNAGGIISRNVRGLPDEESDGWFSRTTTVEALESSTDYNTLQRFADNIQDLHPDFFSYNLPSKSGKFIYSQTANAFKCISPDLVKIERKVGGTIHNTYTITDEDGKIFYFETKQSATSDEQGLQVHTQSWYLSKIMTADKTDSVVFKYTTNTALGGSNEIPTETINRDYFAGTGANWYSGATESQISYTHHSYVALKEIIFRNGKVEFESVTPRRDYLGTALDAIVVYSKTETGYDPIYRYSFDYSYFISADPQVDHLDYRLKLTAVHQESVGQETEKKSHYFEYNSTLLPRFNSRSQDYWGFYNGASFNDLLPRVLPSPPELYNLASNNNFVGNGNRQASESHIRAGILEKVLYPTKGYSVFKYSLNRYKSDNTNSVLVPHTVYSARVVGARKGSVVTKTEAVVWPADAASNTGKIQIIFSPHTNPGAADVAQRLILKDLTTGTQRVWEHTGDFTVALTIEESHVFDPTHSYQITTKVDDISNTYISVSITAQKVLTQTQSLIKQGAGLRIDSIINYDSNNNLLSKDVYTYSSFQAGDGVGILTRNDKALEDNFTRYAISTLIDPGNPCGGATVVPHITYYGTGVYSTLTFSGVNIFYNTVVKTSYDNKDVPNGKTISEFDLTSYSSSSTYNPRLPGGKEYIDNTLGSTSLPLNERYFAYTPTTKEFKLVREKGYHYTKMGDLREKIVTVWRKILYPGGLCINSNSYLRDFEKLSYYISTGGLKLDSSFDSYYNSNGEATTTASTFGYNSYHQLNKSTETNSEGKIVSKEYKYATDFSNNTYASNLLREKHINNRVLDETILINGEVISKTATTYKSTNGVVVADFIQKGLNESSLEKRINYHNYDNRANLLEIAKEGGPKTCYVWSYSGAYPIAKVENIEYATLESLLGGKSSIESFRNKVLPTDLEIANFLSPLKIQSIGNNFLVTQYTYKPLVGMTSIALPTGQTTNYEYDGFQQLKNIKDQNNAIVKSFQYHYKQ